MGAEADWHRLANGARADARSGPLSRPGAAPVEPGPASPEDRVSPHLLGRAPEDIASRVQQSNRGITFKIERRLIADVALLVDESNPRNQRGRQKPKPDVEVSIGMPPVHPRIAAFLGVAVGVRLPATRRFPVTQLTS